jgi:hypothetical protein
VQAERAVSVIPKRIIHEGARRDTKKRKKKKIALLFVFFVTLRDPSWINLFLGLRICLQVPLRGDRYARRKKGNGGIRSVASFGVFRYNTARVEGLRAFRGALCCVAVFASFLFPVCV